MVSGMQDMTFGLDQQGVRVPTSDEPGDTVPPTMRVRPGLLSVPKP
jgi:hypothetical protein